MRYLAAVRRAIPQLAEPFTTGDVCRALGVGTTGCPYHGVFQALDALAGWHELTKEHRHRGRLKAICVFKRTTTFRTEEANPENAAYAAEFLQKLALRWTLERREREAHVPAD